MAEELVTDETVRGSRHLVAVMGYDVDVSVLPLELKPLLAVAQIGVSHRQPAERLPGLRRERHRHQVDLLRHGPCLSRDAGRKEPGAGMACLAMTSA